MSDFDRRNLVFALLFSTCVSQAPALHQNDKQTIWLSSVKADLCRKEPTRCAELAIQEVTITPCSDSCGLVEFQGRDRDGIIVFLHDGAGGLACLDSAPTTSWRGADITCGVQRQAAKHQRLAPAAPAVANCRAIRNDAGVAACLFCEFSDDGGFFETPAGCSNS